MKVTSSSLQLGAETSALERHERHETLTLWTRGRRHGANRATKGRNGHAAGRKEASHGPAVNVSLSQKARSSGSVSRTENQGPVRLDSMDRLKLDILKALIEKLTGKKIEISTADEIACPGQDSEAGNEASAPDTAGFGMEYDYYESHYERQDMTFSASGSIKTADGRQIEFNVDLSMSREFYSEQHVRFRAGDALEDPLSVNFSGKAAQLTSTRFSFDIDADGTSEQISFVRPGSGFLALDKNGDGKINNGRELFGALTGDGFEELSNFDEDGNNFIDENDSIFQRLRIWEKDKDGHDRLLALGQVGIGAIYLGSVDSAFDLKDQFNHLLGRINSTGLFIRENGTAGTIQQLDLVV